MPDNEVEIIFKTKAELEGAQRLKTELEQQVGAAKALGKEHGELSEKLEKVNGALRHSGAELRGFGHLLHGVTRGPIAAVAAGLGFLAHAIEESKDALIEA